MSLPTYSSHTIFYIKRGKRVYLISLCLFFKLLTDFDFLFVPEFDLQFSQSNMVRRFAEKRCEKREAKLKKLFCMFCGTEGFSHCYRIAEHVMSPACWEMIRANRRSVLKRRPLSPTRRSYNFVRDSFEGCQSPFRTKQSKAILICENEIGDDQSE